MDISCHSFIRMARLAAPLMTEGGTMFAMSYYGANRVVPNYNVMGPVKAALEAACRYLAYELGPRGIRVHAISPGPLKTRAASGLKDFELLLNEAAQKAPLGELVDIMDVGFACAYLATPLRAADHRRNGLCRRRRQHRRLTRSRTRHDAGCIAVLNAGSSSIKFAHLRAGQRRRAAVPRAGRGDRRRAAAEGRGRGGRGRRRAKLAGGRARPSRRRRCESCSTASELLPGAA